VVEATWQAASRGGNLHGVSTNSGLLMYLVVGRLLADTAFVALLLFGAAGTLSRARFRGDAFVVARVDAARGDARRAGYRRRRGGSRESRLAARPRPP